MKHNHNHDNVPGSGTQLVPVRFEFTHPTAKTVCVAGTFNHWQPEAKTLHSSAAGNWWKETNLAPGTYEYCFVVDGQWIGVTEPSDSQSVRTIKYLQDVASKGQLDFIPQERKLPATSPAPQIGQLAGAIALALQKRYGPRYDAYYHWDLNK
jgi:AMP-activated protein kinase-like protein